VSTVEDTVRVCVCLALNANILGDTEKLELNGERKRKIGKGWQGIGRKVEARTVEQKRSRLNRKRTNTKKVKLKVFVKKKSFVVLVCVS
jgi:hypothetical protein